MLKLLRFTTLYLISLVIGSLTFAYAYNQNNPLDRRGEGVSEISGWLVKNVNYIPAIDPTFVSAVEFDLDSAAAEVHAKLVSASGQYVPCTHQGNNHWFCHFEGVRIASIDELRVIAVSR